MSSSGLALTAAMRHSNRAVERFLYHEQISSARRRLFFPYWAPLRARTKALALAQHLVVGLEQSFRPT